MLIVFLQQATTKIRIKMAILDLNKGVTSGNTPPKVYLVALERLCRLLDNFAKFSSIVDEVLIEKA
jgi:hypothetical protein